ncbi:hypothetical protein M0208_03670 [Sphingomonas sp. SUN019]|uniref:hypothetical protein n=1 Tax=Sphingomonas sp. SUN019 TaxID=2937788 RepID=UPI00216432BE|nr:hypothetical protein [Sphingomonas sp. SUN019]UVO49650.1 hypothetical protein M0208_03670 [Sphingomonas sp. SUN019]
MDFSPSPTVPYSNASLLKCQAFVVFSHAEMQSYWEAVTRRILSEAEDRWKNSCVVDRVLAALVAFRQPERVSVPLDPLAPHSGGNFEKIVEQAIKTQANVVGENNGIKRKNIADLLVPLGVFPGDLIETMLIQLDRTGKARGDMVHKSSKVSLRTIRDPFADEMKDIEELIAEIEKFDCRLESLNLLSRPEAHINP